MQISVVKYFLKQEYKMKIRNNTNYKLVIYVGDKWSEEPTAHLVLASGDDMDLSDDLHEDISIQEK